jgi:transposase
MEAYPQKLRELVLDAYDEGLKTSKIAKQFKVSGAWARRVKQRLQESNLRSAIEQKHGPNPLLTEGKRLELAAMVKEAPDATVKQLHERLNMPVSVSTVCRALNDMKLTLKKSRITPARGIGPT